MKLFCLSIFYQISKSNLALAEIIYIGQRRCGRLRADFDLRVKFIAQSQLHSACIDTVFFLFVILQDCIVFCKAIS